MLIDKKKDGFLQKQHRNLANDQEVNPETSDLITSRQAMSKGSIGYDKDTTFVELDQSLMSQLACGCEDCYSRCAVRHVTKFQVDNS
jgi:hypothetical protein